MPFKSILKASLMFCIGYKKKEYISYSNNLYTLKKFFVTNNLYRLIVMYTFFEKNNSKKNAIAKPIKNAFFNFYTSSQGEKKKNGTINYSIDN
jgi:hypothetical protein